MDAMPPAPPTTRRAAARTAVAGALAVGALAACAERATGPGAPTPRRDLTASEQQTVRASSQFAFGLLRALGAGARGRNLVISPYSGLACLGMVLNGAAGNTLAGMQQALGLTGQPVATSNATFRELTTYLLGADPAVTVRTANSVWTMTGFPVRPEFSDAVRTNFGAAARTVTFGTPAASQAINAWASDATGGLIPKVFDDGQPDASTIALLVNALYFKGSWTQRFDATQTAPRPFHLADGTSVPVPTMWRANVPLRVGGVGGVQVGELAYGNGAYVMTILLPAPGDDVDALAASLTPATWDALVATLHEARQLVSLPKFTLTGETVWNTALQQLGMADAFSTAANFTPLSPACAPGKCVLSLVKQNIYVRVDEEGTEAAAVTSGVISLTSLAPSFDVDRPFLFAIRERASGAILFLGRIADPRG